MSSRWSHASASLATFSLLALAGCAWMHGHEARIAPPQVEELDPQILAKFQHEIEEYVELHQELLKRVPTVSEHSTSEEIAAHRKKMTTAIRAERRKAKQGDIFKPKVVAPLREILQKELAGPQGQAMIQELRSGNPRVEGTPRKQDPSQETKRGFSVAVNAVYPEDAPLSSVPASLLLHLPPLPEQVKYGFVGRDLILRDTEAGVILDFIRDVVPDPTLPR